MAGTWKCLRLRGSVCQERFTSIHMIHVDVFLLFWLLLDHLLLYELISNIMINEFHVHVWLV